MAAVKLKSVKLANSIKAGTKEDTFLTDETYDLTLDGYMVYVKSAKNPRKNSFTTLFNVIGGEFLEEPEAKETAKKAGK